MNQHSSEASQTAEASAYSVRAEISRQMVRLYKDQFGRGPTRARTEFAGPDVVISTLEDSFTPAERKMADMGEDQRLRDSPRFRQRHRYRQGRLGGGLLPGE